MSNTNTPRDSARRRQRSLVLEHLDNPDIDVDDERFSREEEHSTPIFIEKGGLEPHEMSLEETIAWLNRLCEQEQAQYDLLSDSVCRAQALRPKSMWKGPGMDTAKLEELRRDGPRKEVFEDLLAPVRLQSRPPRGSKETYNDMKRVLLTWNRHVASKRGDNDADGVEAQQAFVVALSERIKAADKVLAIVKDKHNPDRFDKIGQEGILEPSRRRLLKALHVYHPETISFKNQDPFAMLVILWAHIRNAHAGSVGDDGWIYLAFKAMNMETQLERRFKTEKNRMYWEEKQKKGFYKGDQDDVTHYAGKLEAYNEKVIRTAVHVNLNKIHDACQGLRNIVLDQMLELTAMQAAQKWVERDSREAGLNPPWSALQNACAEADNNVELRRETCLPDLDVASDAIASLYEEMMNIQATMPAQSTASRTSEGQYPITAMRMSETLNGTLELRKVARKILEHVEAMEGPLDKLLYAAKTQFKEYNNLARLIDPEQSLSVNGDDGAEEAEEGLRKRMSVGMELLAPTKPV